MSILTKASFSHLLRPCKMFSFSTSRTFKPTDSETEHANDAFPPIERDGHYFPLGLPLLDRLLSSVQPYPISHPRPMYVPMNDRWCAKERRTQCEPKTLGIFACYSPTKVNESPSHLFVCLFVCSWNS